MQSILINPRITKEIIIDRAKFNELKIERNYLLYSDNILEGITLLNDLTLDELYLKLYAVLYEPMDQPIYIFEDEKTRLYAIKICGAYDKWELPREASQIINYVDLPDYIFYSIEDKKVILAGENTETASVGNSQWQREGRKIGAARIGVPFIYQTFYSGRDESQSAIREPSSLQVYNHIIYSVRYKTPSFVSYFENNFANSCTRKRNPVDSKELFIHYIKSIILFNCDQSYIDLVKKFEIDFLNHMINYLREPKYSDYLKHKSIPRLEKDLPCLKKILLDELLDNTDTFVNDLVAFLHTDDKNEIDLFLERSRLLDFDDKKFSDWKAYSNKENVKDIIGYLSSRGVNPKSYINGNSKIGFADTTICREYLTSSFKKYANSINEVFKQIESPKTIIMPLRIHKYSNGKLTFSPDPESGEIVAFSELFSINLRGKRTKPIIGYCIVNTPENFSILDKKGTKLYKAIAEYVDILIINNKYVYINLCNTFSPSDYCPDKLLSTKPLHLTEEMGVVSTYLNQSTINSDWDLCFIHTHHSSWQQLVIHKGDQCIQEKVDRVSTKVDLIMQQGNKFMISEGKNNFQDLLSDVKIKKAMELASKKINSLYKESNVQFDAFIYNFQTNPKKNPGFYIAREAQTVQAGMRLGHMDDIAHHDSYVVIIVYTESDYRTHFRLVYSDEFDKELKKQLDKEFDQ